MARLLKLESEMPLDLIAAGESLRGRLDLVSYGSYKIYKADAVWHWTGLETARVYLFPCLFLLAVYWDLAT
ncbi:hypothetical protein EJ05DRAFT_162506 [Pseudovirgaria hyperparasitica]|uniref:Uncharacterized protein n=1 Tax=Pseudovirgaria hyperparasitica TaxID=470096 RepID=A0A6A6VXM2_9PEZI|nr:uncharacterized protein EJ05DRAFT_162506 [Pseudovirgaria hyperparasitica]KAF2754017.1 hypothetical protein EJ05DRAFT_162506 [Pseudovirgaria hyperparasitica]